MMIIIFFSDRGFDTSSPLHSRKLWLPSQARALPPDDGKREGNGATARWQMDGLYRQRRVVKLWPKAAKSLFS